MGNRNSFFQQNFIEKRPSKGIVVGDIMNVNTKMNKKYINEIVVCLQFHKSFFQGHGKNKHSSYPLKSSNLVN